MSTDTSRADGASGGEVTAVTRPRGGIERRSIDVVPASERHGTPINQFTLWCGANLQITAIVDGALAVALGGVDPIWAIVALLIGNVLGGVVMALHSAQGPRLGLPQMISSRAQFGVLGAIVPLVLVVVMYLGFAATGTVLTGQAINKILGVQAPWVGIVIFGILTAILAIVGYRWIHRMGRFATVVGALGLLWVAIVTITRHNGLASFGTKPFELPGFLLAVGLGAGWQLTFGPYVADYSRYLPQDTDPRKTFHFTLWGSVIGSMFSMALGAMIAGLPQAAKGGFTKNQVGFIGDLVGGGAVALAIYFVIVIGKLTVNTLNAYGGSMTLLTTATAIRPRAHVSTLARSLWVAGFIAVSVVIALAATADFLNLFKNFVLFLLMVFTPWSAINLVDYYLVSKERVDIPALYDRHGRYGAWNVPALLVYFFGIAIQIPFLNTAFYTGPATTAMGGADISWIIGLFTTAVAYWFAVRGQRHRIPPEMIYPSDSGLTPEGLHRSRA